MSEPTHDWGTAIVKYNELANRNSFTELELIATKSKLKELRRLSQAILDLKGDVSYHSPYELIAAFNALAEELEKNNEL